MRENMKFLLIIIIIMGGFAFLINPKERPPADQLNLEVATGYDVLPSDANNVEYEIDREFAVFGEDNAQSSKVDVTVAHTVGQTRQLWQLRADKEKVFGFIKVSMFSESFARHGIMTAVGSLFKDPGVNDTATFVVCKGKPSTILNHKVKGVTDVGDFIQALIKSEKGYDFFNYEYSTQDMFVRLDSEGRNIVIPYIELKEDGIQITGMALFKHDKMVAVAGIRNARIMNMLLNNNASGIVTLFTDNKYIDLIARSNRRVKCNNKDGKYSFVINIKLTGDIGTNSISHKSFSSISEEKNFEKLMADSVKKQCNEFISKMKNEYKVDCLELGRVAAAKYGRRTGVDWNKVVMDSDIQVNVEVTLDKQGRGEY